MVEAVKKILPKSDGNGGYRGGVKPVWFNTIISGLMLALSISAFVFGYGVKSAKIDSLEKGRLENRQLIDVSICDIKELKDRQTQVMVDIARLETKMDDAADDIRWLRANEVAKLK